MRLVLSLNDLHETHLMVVYFLERRISRIVNHIGILQYLDVPITGGRLRRADCGKVERAIQ